MITLKRVNSQEDLKAAHTVREQVFVLEQNVPREAECDQYEATAKHYLAMYDDVPCGAARWRETEQGIKLERFAVLQPYRNKNIGAHVLQAVLEDVLANHADKKIYLNAQLPAVNFYKRHGFITEGEMFSECAIDHYKMVYKG
ncbi:putative GNAT family N-acyltransferase [Pontibacter aydingkolensis]|uniref:GNAT family N-acetyltransferase n=1 Tax=Pontibacter aydingkolensis TaxID=1911536 RepID=A0ABS7CUD2_9BACT|nr:GNAT family N-acetyltransferase [Pontibacter aydingkolensis]MBW7467466.1 GNAT family N-acetyltransferase [Pontibacter aydingkolensis]